MTIANILDKAERLLAQLIASQPKDRLITLSPEQREFYEKWWAGFKLEHSETPDALYEAILEHKGWTPLDWLHQPKITTGMSTQDAADIFREQIGH